MCLLYIDCVFDQYNTKAQYLLHSVYRVNSKELWGDDRLKWVTGYTSHGTILVELYPFAVVLRYHRGQPVWSVPVQSYIVQLV